MEGSKHAVGLTLSNGAEILIHEGIDTVNMEGEGFKYFVKEGQKVNAGDKLLQFDSEKIKAHGYETTCIFVVTNGDEYPDMKGIGLFNTFTHTGHLSFRGSENETVYVISSGFFLHFLIIYISDRYCIIKNVEKY